MNQKDINFPCHRELRMGLLRHNFVSTFIMCLPCLVFWYHPIQCIDAYNNNSFYSCQNYIRLTIEVYEINQSWFCQIIFSKLFLFPLVTHKTKQNFHIGSQLPVNIITLAVQLDTTTETIPIIPFYSNYNYIPPNSVLLIYYRNEKNSIINSGPG